MRSNDRFIVLFRLAEFILTNSTERTNPICRKILECCARSDAVVWVTYSRIVNISTYIANILFHNSLLFLNIVVKPNFRQ